MELDETEVSLENASARPASSSTNESRSQMQLPADTSPSTSASDAQSLPADLALLICDLIQLHLRLLNPFMLSEIAENIIE